MKLGFFRFVTLVLLFFPYYAASEEFYVGVDLGELSFDQGFLSDTENYAVAIGYSWNYLALEGLINFSDSKSDEIGGDQTVSMYHLYGVYRTNGRYYFKAKAGITRERYSVEDGSGNEIVNDVHTGIARGVGLGIRADSASAELEYSWLGGSLNLVNLGLKYHF